VLRTQLIRQTVIVTSVVCLIVVYNLTPYWTRKINWLPKTRMGQIILTFLALGFFLIYCILIGIG
jgi:hypothetical protein